MRNFSITAPRMITEAGIANAVLARPVLSHAASFGANTAPDAQA